MIARLHAAFHEPDTRIYRVVQGTVVVLILLSIAALAVEALLPEDSPIAPLMGWLDNVALAIFAVEIVLRVASFRPPSREVFRHPPLGRLRTDVLARIGYIFRPMSVIDIVSVLTFFPGLRGLRALRLLRLLRTEKIFRYRNPFTIIMYAFEENTLLFSFAFSVLGGATLLGGISFYLVETRLNPAIGSVFDGLWWALVTITTVGFGDITPVTALGRVVGAVVMVSGMFTLALFAGIVGSSLVHSVLCIREEQFRMSAHVNHVVVCGYDESTHLLLEALTKELNTAMTRVVFFDDHERPRDLPPDFIWVQGDPTKESELDKVRLTHAAAVIVSGARDMTPQDADARTILTCFTIRGFLGNHAKAIKDRIRRLYVVAEILDSENVDHARAAGADEVIETRKIGYSMIAHAVGHHGTATTMSSLLMSGAHNVYIGKIPDAPHSVVRFGALQEQVRLQERGGLVIGVRSPGGSAQINPPQNLEVEPGSLLIYLAEQPLLEPPA